MFERPVFQRYAFVMIATRDLAAARVFWVERLGFPVTAEKPGKSLQIDAGGLRLYMDLQPATQSVVVEPDPVIWLEVRSLEIALSSLAARGITEDAERYSDDKGRYAILHDPDGRAVVLTQSD